MTTPLHLSVAAKARCHRLELEAARKLDRARQAYCAHLLSTGFHTSETARAAWLNLLRAEVAVEATVQSQKQIRWPA